MAISNVVLLYLRYARLTSQPSSTSGVVSIPKRSSPFRFATLPICALFILVYSQGLLLWPNVVSAGTWEVTVKLTTLTVHDDCDEISEGDWFVGLSGRSSSGIFDLDVFPSIQDAANVDTGETVTINRTIRLPGLKDADTVSISVFAHDCDNSLPVVLAPPFTLPGVFEPPVRFLNCNGEEEVVEASGDDDNVGVAVQSLTVDEAKRGRTLVLRPSDHDCGVPIGTGRIGPGLPPTYTAAVEVTAAFHGSAWAGFVDVFSQGDGVINAIKPNSDFVWYRHTGFEAGQLTWANNATERVLARGPGAGRSWEGFRHVFGGGEGVVYAVKPNGDLVWYRHSNPQTGAPGWANNGSERVIARGGWASYRHIFSGGNGVIYAVKPDGVLAWFRHTGFRTGDPLWANNGHARIQATGTGPEVWATFEQVFSGGDGIIYATTPRGTLVWFNHTSFRTGAPVWQNGGHHSVLAAGSGPGSGWSQFERVFSGGNGVIYGIRPNGDLVWYRHLAFRTGTTGAGAWAHGGAERLLISGGG